MENEGFRGISAPASLKPVRSGADDAWARRFPGHFCPGLIEAAALAPTLRASPAGFRGISAPASLKPLGLGDEIRELAAFPGHFCPGLIEAVRPRR